MGSRRVLAVVNKAAGGPTDELVGALQAVDGLDLEVAWTAGQGDGTRLTAAALAGPDRPDVVVAIGGDGTSGEVARGLLGAPLAPPLLIAPGGTGNSNFRSLWDDLPWPEVVRAVLVDGDYLVRPLDLMHLVELDSPTMLGVSTGLIPEGLVLAKTLPLSGRERLMTAALQVLGSYQPYPGRVLVDGEVMIEANTYLTLVGGVRYRAGLLRLLPDSMLDDGLLDVLVVDESVSVEAFGTAALGGGDVGEVDGVHLARGARVRVERTDGQPLKLEHDGELETGSHSGYEVYAMPGAISVVLPNPAPNCFAPLDQSHAADS
ncbi:MAG TPA: diacylglycerol kinase family protein [Sporichthyaceae bacterium]|jgi:diacylglycerol kinase (ATP)|nr:diacylglycerol kinase family protein [Sporichthyaceae bacterium]